MTSEAPPSKEASRREAGYVIAFVLSCIAVFWAVFATGLSARAVDKAGKTSVNAAAPAASAPVTVTLSEFKVSPATIQTTTGSTITVTNTGSVAHNLTVKDKKLATPDLAPKQSAPLDISTLPAGEYTVICAVPGHETAGMTAKLVVKEGAATGQDMAAMGSGPAVANQVMSADQMDKAMHDRTAAFPAKTAGLGGQLLPPTVAPDGTKVFDVTAAVTKWEVEPGKSVDAMTYNGVVPGPTIQVGVGDKVRVNLHNKLQESTSIHFHGIETPNAMDGVPDITQEPVKPGASFTYEFIATRASVGMYHSHQDAVKQVPDGLAGAFLIGDMPVPAGLGVTQSQTPQHTPMMLNDAGVIGFAINGKSFPATAPIVAKPDEWIEVQYMNEGVQIHPMHLHGMDQIVIAKDGHPLAQPQAEDTVTVAPGERYTVLVHATEPGVWAWHCHILPHAERSDGMFGMVTALVVK